ncbi:2-hydroxyacid dehydrogenase [Pseudoalteromonas sp. T1lg65]|uniref:2-hydroxyacid dehydrogenase n=1 Tax=Pseudoalteromonas sp. T1lg65 TaxID=2077101 RepID=UPI003F79B5CA
MAFLVCVTGRNNEKLISRLQMMLPDDEIVEWPCAETKLQQVEFVLAWNVPDELWNKLPNLKVVQSFGAGVDSIPVSRLPSQVEVTRIVDPKIAEDMSEYVLTHILAHKLRISEYASKQQLSTWKPRRSREGKTVGIMGMGQLGLAVAQRLLANHFTVKGWSSCHKEIEGVAHFFGLEQLSAFYSELNYLVCLLPLTDKTSGILGKQCFTQLPNDCVLLNVARGAHLDESALIEALDAEAIAGAILDVFQTEPLPSENKLWKHPKVTVTPHVAALTSLDTALSQIVDNYKNMVLGLPLENTINREKSY